METAINGKAAETLQAYLGEHNKVHRYEVRNKWLVAHLANGISFRIKQEA